MNYQEALSAIKDAENTLNNANEIVRKTGKLMIGRLRQMSPYDLVRLKRELQQFNANTKEWKN